MSSEAEKLAKLVLKSAHEVESVAKVITLTILFAVGLLLVFLLGVWLFSHQQVILPVLAVYVIFIGLALFGVE